MLCIEEVITEIQESVSIILSSKDPITYHDKYVNQFKSLDKENIVGMLVSFLDSSCIITDISFEEILQVNLTGVVCTFDAFVVDPNSSLSFISIQQMLNGYPRFHSII